MPARWLICTPDALSAGRTAANLNFNVWDPSALVVAASANAYSYPYTISVARFSGCQPAGADSSGVGVSAPFCPTVGGASMTVVGVNLQPPLTVYVGQFLVPVTRIAVTDPDNFTSFEFALPAGSGLQLPLSVRSGVEPVNAVERAVVQCAECDCSVGLCVGDPRGSRDGL